MARAGILLERDFSVHELEAPVPGEGPLGKILAQQHVLETQLQCQLLMLQRAEEERNHHRMMLLQMKDGLDRLHDKVAHTGTRLCSDSPGHSEQKWNTISSDPVGLFSGQDAYESTTKRDISVPPPVCEPGSDSTRNNDRKPETKPLATEEQHGQPVKSEMNCSAWSGLRAVVGSHQFEFVFAVLICLNAVSMAAELQNSGLELGWQLGVENVRRPPNGAPAFKILEFCFLIAFVLEVSAKLLAFPLHFFRSALNVLDLLSVLLAAIDLFKLAKLGIDPTMVRLFRLYKLTRYLRMLKNAAWLDVLRLILKSIKGSLSTVIWSLLLLFMIQSVSGLMIGQLLMEYMKDETLPNSARHAIYAHWGTFWRIVCSMFEITFVNANTASIRVLMDSIDLAWGSFFMVYRVSINFVLLNVVKAVIVKQTFKVADTNTELLLQQTLRSESSHRRRMKHVFDMMDGSKDGKISKSELTSFVRDPDVELVLRSLDLTLTSLELNELFHMLDADNSGYVDFEEVLQGFAKIQGQAKSIDMQQALVKIDNLRREFSRLTFQIQRVSPLLNCS